MFIPNLYMLLHDAVTGSISDIATKASAWIQSPKGKHHKAGTDGDVAVVLARVELARLLKLQVRIAPVCISWKTSCHV